MAIVIRIIILLLAVAGMQCLVRKFINWLNGQIDKADGHIRNSLSIEQGIKELKERNSNLSDFYQESTNLFLIKKKKEKLNFITTIIGVIEIALFGGLAFILVQKNYSFYEIFNTLTTFAGGWIALKVIGNYQQWSGAVFGRACFYIFFMGTIFNIVIAILIGLVAAAIF